MSKDRIRELNDAFRQTFRGGKVMMTSGVCELPDCVKAEALLQVANFSEFSADNDPHASTISGASTWWGASCFGRSITTTRSANSAPTTRPTLKDNEGPHHHACHRVLGRTYPSRFPSAPSLNCEGFSL